MANGHPILSIMQAFEEDPAWARSLWDSHIAGEDISGALAARGLEDPAVADLLQGPSSLVVWKSLARLSTQLLGEPHAYIN